MFLLNKHIYSKSNYFDNPLLKKEIQNDSISDQNNNPLKSSIRPPNSNNIKKKSVILIKRKST